MLTAPLSHQQRETLRSMAGYPATAQRYEGVSLFRLDAEVDLDCLAGALGELAQRHPGLRTVIEGEQQRVLPEWDLSAPDASDEGAIEQLSEALMEGRRDLAEVLSGQSLFRAGLHRRQGQSLLSIRLHHLISDGWSHAVLWRDLSELYAARLEKRLPVLPELKITYAEICERQAREHGERLERAVAFYREALGEADGSITWPAPAEPYLGEPTDGGEVELTLPAELGPRIRKLSRGARVSPFLVLLAATAAAVSRRTGVAEVLSGVDTANRSDPGCQDIVGFLINTRVLRVPVSAHRDLTELLKAVRGPWMAAAEHEGVYYDQVLSALGDPQLFKVNLPNLAADWSDQERQLRLGGLPLEEVPLDTHVPSWRNLSAFWFVHGQDYRVRIYHRLAAVSPELAQAVIEDICDVLATGRLTGD